MEKLSNKKVRSLTCESFNEHPVWCWDESEEYKIPVATKDHVLPNDLGDLFIRAVLVANDGNTFNGYIIGPYDVSRFGLFWNKDKYHFNMDLRDFLLMKLRDLSKNIGEDLDVFPLKYETDFLNSDGQPVSGVIELKPRVPIL